jgi:transposase, IS30 family
MTKKYFHLSFNERTKIEVFLDHGATLAGTARAICRHPSTVSREVKRSNRYSLDRYIAHFGQAGYSLRRKRAGRLRRKLGPDLSTPIWQNILAELRHGLSPEQYAGCTRLLDGLHMPAHKHSHLFASHQTIYCGIRDLPHGPGRAELTRLLRRSTKGRRPRRASSRYTGLQNMTPLDQRPKDADSRLTLGHWEGDLIKGAANGSAIGTLVERASRMVLLVHLPSANADDVFEGFKRVLSKLPSCARKSLTYDRGSEMARHLDLSKALNMPIFFCPPYRPGDRATNENTNGLLRQYLPKGTDLSVHSPADLAVIESRLNTRGRRILGFHTPLARFHTLLRDCLATSA